MNSFKNFSLKKLNESQGSFDVPKTQDIVYFIGYENDERYSNRPHLFDINAENSRLRAADAEFFHFYLDKWQASEEYDDLRYEIGDDDLRLFKARVEYHGSPIRFFVLPYAEHKNISEEKAAKELDKYVEKALNADTMPDAKKMMKHPITKWLMKNGVEGFSAKSKDMGRKSYVILLYGIDYFVQVWQTV